jgi:hypothetical protein
MREPLTWRGAGPGQAGPLKLKEPRERLLPEARFGTAAVRSAADGGTACTRGLAAVREGKN